MSVISRSKVITRKQSFAHLGQLGCMEHSMPMVAIARERRLTHPVQHRRVTPGRAEALVGLSVGHSGNPAARSPSA